jgi:hypothetical protein
MSSFLIKLWSKSIKNKANYPSDALVVFANSLLCIFFNNLEEKKKTFRVI